MVGGRLKIEACLTIASIVLFTTCSLSEELPGKKQTSGQEQTTSAAGWSAEETVLAEALVIRSRRLEKAAGIHFSPGWKPKVDIEWSIATEADERNIAARYDPGEQIFLFPMSIIAEMTVRHDKIPLSQLEPAVAAEDELFSAIADHEIGHAIADIVSRRLHSGPFYTMERFHNQTRQGQWGLNIVSEGIGTYFERLLHDKNDVLSPFALPASYEQLQTYSFNIIAFQGGCWLVGEILDRYGERGLGWLVSHPFVPGENMRQDAVRYRESALAALAGPLRPVSQEH
jgi:hypothetical protein